MTGPSFAVVVLFSNAKNSSLSPSIEKNFSPALSAGFSPCIAELIRVKNLIHSFPNSIKIAAIIPPLSYLTFCAAFAQAPPASSDPAMGVIHSRRLNGGLPLGGVGTGTFQLLTDGAISGAALTNNFQRPTGDLNGCFAALWTRKNGKTQTRVLALTSPYGLPTVSALDFNGSPPLASLTYPDDALPVSVSLRAFSPLIPFDLRSSSFPAAAFLFQFRNRSADTVEISIALSWENVLGVGGSAQTAFSDRTGNAIVALPSANGLFGLRFTGSPLTQGTSPAERLRDNAVGEMALLTAPPRKDAAVTLAGWNALDSKPAWWEAFSQSGDVAGTAPTGLEGKAHPAGVVAVRMTLRPGDFAEIPFAVSWRTPRYYTGSGVDYRRYDSARWPDAPASARDLLENWRSLLALTLEWQEALQLSNLPRPLVRDLINSVTPLQTNTIHTSDEKFAFFTGGDVGPVTPERSRSQASDSLLSAFFPSLLTEKSSELLDTEYSLEKSNPTPPYSNANLSARPDPFTFQAPIVQAIAENKPEAALAALAQWDAMKEAAGMSPYLMLAPPGAPYVLSPKRVPGEARKDNQIVTPWLAQAGAWQILDALTGFVYNGKTNEMTLLPHIPGDWRSLVAPIFRPTFQGRMEYKPTAHGGLTTFRMDRLIISAASSKRKTQANAQLIISALRVPAPPRSDLSPTTVHVSVRQEPLGFHLTPDAVGNTLLITLDTPRPLFAGDRIEVDVH